jgi:hypothetical protein
MKAEIKMALCLSRFVFLFFNALVVLISARGASINFRPRRVLKSPEQIKADNQAARRQDQIAGIGAAGRGRLRV